MEIPKDFFTPCGNASLLPYTPCRGCFIRSTDSFRRDSITENRRRSSITKPDSLLFRVLRKAHRKF